MRAQFVYEKFTPDSDPIHDMGIGLVGLWKNLKVGDILRMKKTLVFSGSGDNSIYPENSYIRINDIINKTDFDGRIEISYSYFENKNELLKNIKNWKSFKADVTSWQFSFEFFKEWFQYVNIKDLKQ